MILGGNSARKSGSNVTAQTNITSERSKKPPGVRVSPLGRMCSSTPLGVGRVRVWRSVKGRNFSRQPASAPYFRGFVRGYARALWCLVEGAIAPMGRSKGPINCVAELGCGWAFLISGDHPTSRVPTCRLSLSDLRGLGLCVFFSLSLYSSAVGAVRRGSRFTGSCTSCRLPWPAWSSRRGWRHRKPA